MVERATESVGLKVGHPVIEGLEVVALKNVGGIVTYLSATGGITVVNA